MGRLGEEFLLVVFLMVVLHTLFVVPRPWLLQISGVAEKNRQYPYRIYSAVDNVGVPFSNNLYWETVARGGKELLVIYG